MANFRRRFMPHVIAFTNRVVWKLDIGHVSAKRTILYKVRPLGSDFSKVGC